MNIAAIIVLYNPQLKLLRKNVEAIINQVNIVYMYDNASSNIEDVEKDFSRNEKIVIIRSKQNNGIAKAVNDCAKMLPIEYDWFVTLDQDSICPSNLIEEYSKFTDKPNIAMMAPRVHTSVGRDIQNRNSSQDFEYIHRCITSASFVNREAFVAIGGMDESMIIDWVDHDLCKHFEIEGWKILQCNNVVLNHNLGSSEVVKFPKYLTRFFHFKPIYKEYSTFRIFHMIRNTIYYMRKYSKHLNWAERRNCLKLIIYHVSLKSLVVGKNKWLIFKTIVSALYKGFTMHTDLEKKYI